MKFTPTWQQTAFSRIFTSALPNARHPGNNYPYVTMTHYHFDCFTKQQNKLPFIQRYKKTIHFMYFFPFFFFFFSFYKNAYILLYRIKKTKATAFVILKSEIQWTLRRIVFILRNIQ